MFATIRHLTIAFALSISAPVMAGETILTVSGDVASPEQGDVWSFNMEDLQSLPASSFATTTIWTEGSHEYEGVPLSVLLDHVGADGVAIRAVALNDYAVSIPITDAVVGGPIVAYSSDGAPMSVRDKGPLWIIYPFDDNDDYKSEEYYSRSIWQLDRIEVVTEE